VTPIENTEGNYGAIAILFHWSVALLVIGLAALELYMVTLPDVGFNTKKGYAGTLAQGVRCVGVCVARSTVVLARNSDTAPALVENLPDWQKAAARFVHLSFCALLFALPITGYLMSSAAGIPVSFFGLLMLPDLSHRDQDLFARYVSIQQWLGYVLTFFRIHSRGCGTEAAFRIQRWHFAKNAALVSFSTTNSASSRNSFCIAGISMPLRKSSTCRPS
jgi:cytochrome b561